MVNLKSIKKSIKKHKEIKKDKYKKAGKTKSENSEYYKLMIECADYVFEYTLQKKTKEVIKTFMLRKKRCKLFKRILKELEENGIKRKHLPHMLWKYHKVKSYYFTMKDFMIIRWILSSQIFDALIKRRKA